MTRSLLPITKPDLIRLGELASEDREAHFERRPQTGLLYRDRLFAVALCQGAALHYVNMRNGIKDFDVWSFYTEAPERRFPPRRRGVADFGDQRFGASPDAPEFIGRRVDLIGRSIRGANPSNPVGTLRDYLHNGITQSARLLAAKAVVLIEPHALLGVVIWPTK